MIEEEHHQLGDAVLQLCHGIENVKVMAALGMVMSQALSNLPEEIGIPAMMDLTMIIIRNAYPNADIEITDGSDVQ